MTPSAGAPRRPAGRRRSRVGRLQWSCDASAGIDATRDDLVAAIGDLHAGGGTALYEGVVDGARALGSGRHRKKVLLLVTDGNSTSHRSNRGSATRAVQQSEALVYALGIGHSDRDSLRGRLVVALNGPQMDLMRSFADAAGGRAVLFDEINGGGRKHVVDAITTFGEELRQQYTIDYYPPVHGGGKTVHQILISTSHRDQIVRARKCT